TKQVDSAHEVVKRGLSVREAERLVTKMLKPQDKKVVSRDRDVAHLEEELSEKLGASVHISANRKGAGRISIEFASLDQLDELLRRVR
ncbi:MAG: chromosome partitioning protein ParB, partial [Hydrogenophilales bacterium CG_4_9_14_3_um_filter_63_34]